MTAPLLRATDIRCGYGRIEIVHALSLDCNEGERISIIGANGCGKTTLLKALCGFVPLMGGDAAILGTSIKKMTRREIASALSLMAQISDVWFDFSVFDTVLMGRYSKRKSALSSETSEDREICAEYLKAVGMYELRDHFITNLSGGQLQRILLARAFAQEPSVIVLDEPTNHLDLKHQVELLEFLQEWVTIPGRAVIQVMHDLNLARLYSDRVLLMEDGRLVADGSPNDVMCSDCLNKAYDFDISGFMQKSYSIWE